MMRSHWDTALGKFTRGLIGTKNYDGNTTR